MIEDDDLQQGTMFLKTKRYDESLCCFSKACRKNPMNKEAWYFRGLAYVKLNQKHEALECFNHLLQKVLRKKRIETYFNNHAPLFKKGEEKKEVKKMKQNISKKMRNAIVVLSIVLASTLVSAGLLSYFGRVNTTFKAQQSVVIGDGTNWYNYNKPVHRNLSEVVHCKDYCYKLLIWNRAYVDAKVSFTTTPVDEGVSITHWVFGDKQTIRLVQKVVVFGNAPWVELPGGMDAYLTFETTGEKFVWTVESQYKDNLIQNNYKLIYYANYPDYWQESPAFVIGGLDGSADVPTMPFINDENAHKPISRVGETYPHQYGAKFWLIPASAINEDGSINWGMAGQFLFETDLGFYLDCDDWQPKPLPKVYDTFKTTILKAGRIYSWISCYHVDFYITPGNYNFKTLVNATPLS